MQIYLDSFGAYLSVRNGMFHVRLKNGGDHDFAVRNVGAILQTAGTAMSADALLLAAENDIPVLLIDAQTHQPLAQLSSGRAVSVAAVRRNQAVFTRSPEGFEWVAGILAGKIDAQADLLVRLLDTNVHAGAREAIQGMRRQAQALRNYKAPPPTEFEPSLAAERFRGQEGTASRLYFRELAALLPPELGFQNRSGRPAFDPFNAVLNYLYGMLYTQVHLALLKSGLDPYMAVLHADQYGARPTLAFDLIEIYRPWADEVAVTLAKNGKLSDADFFQPDPDEHGLWLAGAGKSAVIDAMLEFLKTPTSSGDRQIRRSVQIDLEAQKLAVFLKGL